jgi:hypothetical protein
MRIKQTTIKVAEMHRCALVAYEATDRSPLHRRRDCGEAIMDRYVERGGRTCSAPPSQRRRVTGTPMTEQIDHETRNALLDEFEKAISIVARDRDVTPWIVIDACESLTRRCLTEILDQNASSRD